MNVLVTGGAGFIGSHIVDALVERNHTVTVIDSLDPAAHDGPPEWMNPNATWRLGPASGEARSADVAEEATWDGALEGIDAVCHQAAKVGLGVDLTDAPAYAINNDLGTARMLAAMSASGWGGRIVLASSMVVYGEGRYACPDHGIVAPLPRRSDDLDADRWEPRCPTCRRELTTGLVPEDAAIDPRNVYAATKVHQEHLCGAASAELGTVTTARCAITTSMGPGCPATRPTPAWRPSFAPNSPGGHPPPGVRGRGAAAGLCPRQPTWPPPTSPRLERLGALREGRSTSPPGRPITLLGHGVGRWRLRTGGAWNPRWSGATGPATCATSPPMRTWHEACWALRRRYNLPMGWRHSYTNHSAARPPDEGDRWDPTDGRHAGG
jgi:nucleoside-diphosphate-sugar epimerase